MIAHTPGPWLAVPEYEGEKATYVRSAEHLFGESGRMIADCHTGWSGDEANACLIAAAPDLLEAVMFLRACTHGNIGEAFNQIDAIIAKATALGSPVAKASSDEGVIVP